MTNKDIGVICGFFVRYALTAAASATAAKKPEGRQGRAEQFERYATEERSHRQIRDISPGEAPRVIDVSHARRD